MWSYNLNSQSEILELLQKLKASDYRFDNQPTCCYCFEITKKVTHVLNIAENGIEKYSTQSYENIPLFDSIVSYDAAAIEKDIVKYCQTATDLTVNSWVGMFISQVTPIKSQHRVSAVREKKTMIRLVLKTKKSKNPSWHWQTTQGWKCRDEHPETECEDWPGEGSNTNTKLLASSQRHAFVLNESHGTEWFIY